MSYVTTIDLHPSEHVPSRSPRTQLDLPGVDPLRSWGRTDLSHHYHCSMQINANHSLTWMGDEKGSSYMGWAILLAATLLRLPYRISPEDPGVIYLYDASAAHSVFFLAQSAPWLQVEE